MSIECCADTVSVPLLLYWSLGRAGHRKLRVARHRVRGTAPLTRRTGWREIDTRFADFFAEHPERARQWYGFYVAGYVVMPEHVHLLITEPERAKLSLALQMLKQNVARQLREPEGESFWQARYYDFNVWAEAKRIEKLRYIHRNPVVRGLVASPELWAWSSFRHYASGFDGVVEIESQWTARKREPLGRTPQLRAQSQNPRPFGSAQGRLCPCKRRRDKDGAVALVSTFAVICRSRASGHPPSALWVCSHAGACGWQLAHFR